MKKDCPRTESRDLGSERRLWDGVSVFWDCETSEFGSRGLGLDLGGIEDDLRAMRT